MAGSIVSAQTGTALMGGAAEPSISSTPSYEGAGPGKVFSFGIMIGSSLLFPTAYAGESVSPTLTLVFFCSGVVVFGLLHYKEFAGAGLHVAGVAALLLFTLMLFGGTSIAEAITPLIPLYITVSCLITPCIYTWKPNIRAWMAGVNRGDGTVHSHTTRQIGSNSESERSSEEERSSYDPYHLISNTLGHMGPPSHYSRESGSTNTTISLGNVDGARRNPGIGGLILGNAYGGDQGDSSFAYPYQAASHMENGQARVSMDRSLASLEALRSNTVMSAA